MNRIQPTEIALHTVALIKGDERYLFVFDDTQEPEVLRVFGRFASNPALSFTWYDAALLSQKVHERNYE